MSREHYNKNLLKITLRPSLKNEIAFLRDEVLEKKR